MEDQLYDDFLPTCNIQSECSTCRKIIEMELNINQTQLTCEFYVGILNYSQRQILFTSIIKLTVSIVTHYRYRKLS